MNRVFESLRDFDRVFEGDVSFTPLDKSDKVGSQTRVLGQLFLGPLTLMPKPPYVHTELFYDCFSFHVVNLQLDRLFFHPLLVVFLYFFCLLYKTEG